MQYDEIFCRNIGLFSKEEQNKLRSAKVAVAGAGGVGGNQAVALVRQGIGEISIMDPGVFDEPDMNRQYGATMKNIGINKAYATAEMLRDMNPNLKCKVYKEAAKNRDQMEEFISGSDLVIDAIDYIGFHHKQLLHDVARNEGIYILSGPIPGFGATMMIFSPNGMTVEEFYGAPIDKTQWPDYKFPMDRIMPRQKVPEIYNHFVDGGMEYISTNGACGLAVGGLVGMEAALIITGRRKEKDIVIVPFVSYLDLMNRGFIIFNPLDETSFEAH
jgi:molybdopterin/thiamine biosynthesis adenylyltransferase